MYARPIYPFSAPRPTLGPPSKQVRWRGNICGCRVCVRLRLAARNLPGQENTNRQVNKVPLSEAVFQEQDLRDAFCSLRWRHESLGVPVESRGVKIERVRAVTRSRTLATLSSDASLTRGGDLNNDSNSHPTNASDWKNSSRKMTTNLHLTLIIHSHLLFHPCRPVGLTMLKPVAV